MYTNLIIVTATILMCLLSSFAGAAYAFKSKEKSNNLFLSTFIVFLTFASLIYLFYPKKSDVISPIHWGYAVLPICCSYILYLGNNVLKSTSHKIILLLIASAIATFSLPLDYVIYSDSLPLWANTAITFGIFAFFGGFYKILNGAEGLVITQTITTSLGFTLLSFLGGLPISFSLIAFCFIAICGVNAVYTNYPSKITLSNSFANSIGFMLAWIMVLSASEGSATCGLIFALYFVVEAIVAILKKLTFIDKYKNLENNTFYMYAKDTGLEDNKICGFIARNNIILIVIGLFQIYAPNAFSFPLLGVIVIFWNITRLLNWQTPKQSFNEINKEFVDNIKDEFNSIKNNIKGK